MDYDCARLQISSPLSHPNTFGCTLRWRFMRTTVMHLGDEKDSCGRSAAFYRSRVLNCRRQPPQETAAKNTAKSFQTWEIQSADLVAWTWQLQAETSEVWAEDYRVTLNLTVRERSSLRCSVFIVMTGPYFRCRQMICPAWNTGCCCFSYCICLCCLLS